MPPYTNRLSHETSPYLLQHAHNPVDWYPWGEEALARAVQEDKPIFLSIGYSACHWCHVMERESFEDEATAAYMNARFVNIKVDREERPDLDSIYMEAVQIMTRHGGWPMSVFLMPDGTPFHGGTYFPPTARQGMPSFRQVLEAVADAYAERRDDLQAHGLKMVSFMDNLAPGSSTGSLDRQGILAQATTQLRQLFDANYGGFGNAPKFPQPMTLDFLLTHSWETGQLPDRNMAETTLTHMLNGGIYDQLGGGFHRYSVDTYWLVPHFEKMLYDNAQLLKTYLQAWQVTGQEDYLRGVKQTIAYVLREMTDPAGGFYSAQDADSEGEEGLFFLWSLDEIQELLPAEEARIVATVLDVSAQGNFEGRNILHRPRSLEANCRYLRLPPQALQAGLQSAMQTLWQARELRIRPERDDKILTEWNGLMIEALALCGAVLPHPEALTAARRAADFIWAEMRQPDGRLWRSFKDGRARFNAYLEDYAAYGNALLALFASDSDPRWLAHCQEVAAMMQAEFEDTAAGGFFQTGHRHEKLVVRRKDYLDNAVPSGNSLAAHLYLQLAQLTDRADYRDTAERIMQQVGQLLVAQPTAFGRMLCAVAALDAPSQEVIIVGDPEDAVTQDMAHTARQSYHPHRLVAVLPPDHGSDLPVFAGKVQQGTTPTVYVCHNRVCHQPVNTVEAMREQMQERAG